MNFSKTIPFLLLAAISCKQVDNPKEQFLSWTQKGAITNNVACKGDQSQSYCVYLPSNYDIKKVYPTIYAFDPHEKGIMPVGLMKNIAEKLGYIVIGSNNSRNGLQQNELNYIINTLFSDSQQKLAIDPQRIYLVGFSGGARVACMIAQELKGIRGVVACSAGFHPNGNQMSFRFIGVAGTQDMNYLEMKNLNTFLESAGVSNQLIVFDGKHHWPNEATLSEALTMLEIFSMKDATASKNLEIVNGYLSSSINRINELKGFGVVDSLAKALAVAKRANQVLDGLVNIDMLKSNIDELSKNTNVQRYLNDQSSLEKYEDLKQKEFVESFGSKPEAWWNTQIKELNSASIGPKGDLSKRLMGYISLNCYGYVNGALHYHDWKTASYFTSIYRQVDPENPDSWYALACLQVNTGKEKEAIESLKNAIKFGFTDYSKLNSDPLLSGLRAMSEFNALTKK